MLITIAADNALKFFFFYFSEKLRLNISCESSARQMIHMKYQILFSLKNNNINFRMSSAAILLSALWINMIQWFYMWKARLWSDCTDTQYDLGLGFLHMLDTFLLQTALLTLKMPRKPASENVVCLCRLLNILANFSNLFLHTGKQCWLRSDCSSRSSLIWVHTVCKNDF